MADIPDEGREDLTIHTVDTIDEVLRLAIESGKVDDVLDTPQLWSSDQPPADIGTTVNT